APGHGGRALSRGRRPRPHRLAVPERWRVERAAHRAGGVGARVRREARREREPRGVRLRLPVVAHGPAGDGGLGRARLRRPVPGRAAAAAHRGRSQQLERVRRAGAAPVGPVRRRVDRGRRDLVHAMTFLAVTDRGLARLTERDGAFESRIVLEDPRLQCVAVDPREPGRIFAGSRGRGVWRGDDGGASWSSADLPARDVFSLAVSPADGAVYAGTEPSMIFRSDDGGSSWRELDALRRLPSAPTWSFPPRPWTSHVRWIAPNPRDADLLLAGIELGGLMRSTDGGATWEDHRPGAQKDVHALAWHPAAAERAYEAAGGGAA